MPECPPGVHSMFDFCPGDCGEPLPETGNYRGDVWLDGKHYLITELLDSDRIEDTRIVQLAMVEDCPVTSEEIDANYAKDLSEDLAAETFDREQGDGRFPGEFLNSLRQGVDVAVPYKRVTITPYVHVHTFDRLHNFCRCGERPDHE